MNLSKYRIICAFPGVGKSHLFATQALLSQYKRVTRKTLPQSHERGAHAHMLFDRDSADYPKDQFPDNYLQDIHSSHLSYPNLVQMVSTHRGVLAGLVERRLPHLLVYPNGMFKAHYVERYMARQSPPKFIDHMVENWDQYIKDVSHHGTYCPLALSVEFIRPTSTLSSLFGGDELQ